MVWEMGKKIKNNEKNFWQLETKIKKIKETSKQKQIRWKKKTKVWFFSLKC
jgi:hypothetical protein